MYFKLTLHIKKVYNFGQLLLKQVGENRCFSLSYSWFSSIKLFWATWGHLTKSLSMSPKIHVVDLKLPELHIRACLLFWTTTTRVVFRSISKEPSSVTAVYLVFTIFRWMAILQCHQQCFWKSSNKQLWGSLFKISRSFQKTHALCHTNNLTYKSPLL